MVKPGTRRDHAGIADVDATHPEPPQPPHQASPRPLQPPPPPPPPPPASEPRTRFWRGPKVDGPLRRSSEDRVVAGVAAGLGKRFGFDPTVVRIAFALMAFGG